LIEGAMVGGVWTVDWADCIDWLGHSQWNKCFSSAIDPPAAGIETNWSLAAGKLNVLNSLASRL
jgi:hypothetical protein